MVRLGMFLGIVWVIGFSLMLAMILVRLIFEPEEALPDGFSRVQIALARLTVAILWPVMLPFSKWSREVVFYTLKEHPIRKRGRKK